MDAVIHPCIEEGFPMVIGLMPARLFIPVPIFMIWMELSAGEECCIQTIRERHRMTLPGAIQGLDPGLQELMGVVSHHAASPREPAIGLPGVTFLPHFTATTGVGCSGEKGAFRGRGIYELHDHP